MGDVKGAKFCGSRMIDECLLASSRVRSDFNGWILMVAPVEGERMVGHYRRWNELCHRLWTAAWIEFVLFKPFQLTSHDGVPELRHIIAVSSRIVEIREAPIPMGLFNVSHGLNTIGSTAISQPLP